MRFTKTGFQNLYFDLDMVIFDKLPDLRRHHFTLLDDSCKREPLTLL